MDAKIHVWRCDGCGEMLPGPDLDLDTAECKCRTGQWRVCSVAATIGESTERARKAEQERDSLAAANLAANKRIVELERERDAARRLAQENAEHALDIARERDAARAELAKPSICPNCTAKLRRLDRMDSAGHAAYELDKARKDAAGQNKRAQKAEQEAKGLHAELMQAIAQVKELRAELARLTTPRPIAEAPRDGTWILGYWDETTRWDVGRYSRFLVVQWLHDEWLDEDGNELNAPSHYLPLPEVKP